MPERPREGEAQRSAVASHQGLWTRHDTAERERPSEARGPVRQASAPV